MYLKDLCSYINPVRRFWNLLTQHGITLARFNMHSSQTLYRITFQNIQKEFNNIIAITKNKTEDRHKYYLRIPEIE